MFPTFFQRKAMRDRQEWRNFFLGAVCLRALNFDSNAYLERLKTMLGADDYTLHAAAGGWPPFWSVIRHQQGTIVLFGGARHGGHFLRMQGNSKGTRYYTVPGHVATYVRQWFTLIQGELMEDVLSAPNPNRVVFLGHGGGGAIASLAMRSYAYHHGADKVCWGASYGAPRVGDTDYCRYIRADNLFSNVCAAGDTIPFAPHTLAGLAVFPSAYALFDSFDSYGFNHFIRDNGSFARMSSYLWTPEELPLGWWARALTEGFNLPAEHAIGNYANILRRSRTEPGDEGLLGDLVELNSRMELLVDPLDLVTPVPPVPATPPTSPDTPTIAQVRTVPMATGDPAEVDPPAPVTAFISVPAVMFNRMVSSTSIEPKEKMFFPVKDRKKLEAVIKAVDLLGDTDGELCLDPAPSGNKNGIQVIDQDDDGVRESFDILRTHCAELLDLDKFGQPLT